jgi:hypothetical protein
MKLGPVSLSFAGTVHIEERDDAGHLVVLAAKGQETKGKGAASATVASWLESRGDGTLVKMRSDITLTGTVAQLSRGLLPDVSRRLTAEFAECLRSSITAREQGPNAPVAAPGPSEPAGEATGQATGAAPATPAPARAPARPTSIGGLRLGLWATWRAIVRVFGRLFGRS